MPLYTAQDMLKFIASLFKKGPDIGELLENGAVVIDVRSQQEYKSGHVEGSRNIPLPNLQSKIASLKKQKKVIITCCACGMRSGKGAKILRQHGLDAHNGGPWQSVEKRRV